MNRAILRTMALICLLVSLLAGCTSGPPTVSALDGLQGYWEQEEESVNISGNTLFFYGGEDHWYQTEFTLPPGTDPKQLHATIVEDGSNNEHGHVGQVIVNLYKIEEGVLTLLPLYKDAPTDSFDVSGHGLYELERTDPREGRTRPPTSE